MIKREIIIGSRASALALVQTEMVKNYIEEMNPELSVHILPMTTTGDKILDRPLDQIGGKGLFVKELDQALSDGRTDLSVHSLKDVPMLLPEDLPLIGFSVREDPRDVLVLPDGCEEIDFSKPIGCSSARRMIQFRRLYPQAKFEPIRGNIQTRLSRLDEGRYGATILAAAGLKRLGLAGRISRYFSMEEMIPAAGQGILALQGRSGESYHYLDGYTDEAARWCALAERAFVRRLGGGCTMPAAAYAGMDGEPASSYAIQNGGSAASNGILNGESEVPYGIRDRKNRAAGRTQTGRMTLRAMYLDEHTGRLHQGTMTGDADEAEVIGIKLAEHFLAE